MSAVFVGDYVANVFDRSAVFVLLNGHHADSAKVMADPTVNVADRSAVIAGDSVANVSDRSKKL